MKTQNKPQLKSLKRLRKHLQSLIHKHTGNDYLKYFYLRRINNINNTINLLINN